MPRERAMLMATCAVNAEHLGLAVKHGQAGFASTMSGLAYAIPTGHVTTAHGKRLALTGVARSGLRTTHTAYAVQIEIAIHDIADITTRSTLTAGLTESSHARQKVIAVVVVGTAFVDVGRLGAAAFVADQPDFTIAVVVTVAGPAYLTTGAAGFADTLQGRGALRIGGAVRPFAQRCGADLIGRAHQTVDTMAITLARFAFGAWLVAVKVPADRVAGTVHVETTKITELDILRPQQKVTSWIVGVPEVGLTGIGCWQQVVTG